MPLLQNKYIKIGGATLGILFLIFIAVMVLLTTLSKSTGLSDSYAPTMMIDSDMAEMGIAYNRVADGDYYPAPGIPSTPGYTSDLESYETTNYNLTGRTNDLDTFCDTLITLKTDTQIHFKSLTENLNSCTATFYTPLDKTDATLAALTKTSGVEYTRNTVSVTRHKQRLESQTAIISAQLQSVSRSLTLAEQQFDELAEFARETKDAKSLSEALRYKFENINTLTQQKISLTAQLNNLYQQSADLEERMDVVEFQVSVYRLSTIQVNETKVKWQQAWKDLQNQTTDTLIGLTTVFGIFLLWTIRITIYLLVLIIVIRLVTKFAKKVWQK